MFYNGDYETYPSTFYGQLMQLFEILNFWRTLHFNGEELTAKVLLNLLVDQVIQVVGEIKTKLMFKACYRFKIISFVRPKPPIFNDSDPASEEEEAPEPAEQLDGPIIYDYRQKTEQFDSFVQNMWQYLDLMNRTAPLIEDFYIWMLDALNFGRPNPYTIFQSIHWQAYRNMILKDSTIQLIIKQIDMWS